MFARFGHRTLIAVLPTYAAVLICAVFFCTAVQALDPPEVQGVIATGVHFSGDAREKVATAVFELLASCTASGTASENDWAEALHRKCRLHFKFVEPRTVMMTNDRPDKIEVDEMVITFPLSNGRIWVRSGEKYIWFAKWRPERCKPIQELLKEATANEL